MPYYPVEVYVSDAAAAALDGTTDDETGIKHLPRGTAPTDSPSLMVQWHRETLKLLNRLVASMQGFCVSEGGLNLGVFPATFYLAGVVKTYAGGTVALANSSTLKVWLDSTPALQNGASFPVDLTTFLPLATVVTSGGNITSIVDERSRVLLAVDQSAGGMASTALSNLAAVAVNTTLLSDTDNTDSLGSAALAWASLFLRTSLVLKQATANYTITWADPGAARALNVPDPGAGADFVFTAGAQTLAGKTLTTPTVADFSNATHDHTDAAGGGLLSVPFTPIIYLTGTLSVKVYEIQVVAPFDFTLRNVTGRVNTAPVGQSAICDVRVNGASIFANQTEMVNIAAGTQQDTSATKNHAVVAGDVLTFEVEQVGIGVAGADLTLVVNGLAGLDDV